MANVGRRKTDKPGWYASSIPSEVMPSLPPICQRIQCRRFQQRIEACDGGGGCPYKPKREEYEKTRASA